MIESAVPRGLDHETHVLVLLCYAAELFMFEGYYYILKICVQNMELKPMESDRYNSFLNELMGSIF